MFKNAYELQYFKEGFPICKPYRNPTNPLFKRKHHETRHFAKLRLNNPLPALDNGSLLPVYVRYRYCVEYRRKPVWILVKKPSSPLLLLLFCFALQAAPPKRNNGAHNAKPCITAFVLINTFEVPQGKEAETFGCLAEITRFPENPAGLHRHTSASKYWPDGKYHFVNVARWRSAEEFKAATAKMRQALPDNMPEGVTASPGFV